MIEITWKIVEHYQDYEVSSDGRVRRCTPIWNRPDIVVPYELTKHLSAQGYYVVCLGSTKYLIHRLVASAFIPKLDKIRKIVAHINGIKIDNRVENLRWSTQKENVGDAIRHGTLVGGRKNYKLTKEQMNEVVHSSESSRKLSEKFGVSYQTIYYTRNPNSRPNKARNTGTYSAGYVAGYEAGYSRAVEDLQKLDKVQPPSQFFAPHSVGD